MRDIYVKSLEELNIRLIKMGKIVEDSISKSIVALTSKDIQLAKEVIENDCEIDAYEKHISSLCMSIMLLQQPVASDLRLVTAISKIIIDLERIGDHASDIAEIVLSISKQDYGTIIDTISVMAKSATKMLGLSIDAYIRRDTKLADEVIKLDDKVDNLFVEIKDKLSMAIKNGEKESLCAVDLIMIAKYLERVGDHSVNIAEWTLYCKTGDFKK